MFNQHFTMSQPRPLLPSMVEVGGFQISDTLKPLPQVNISEHGNCKIINCKIHSQDIQKWMDEAEHGVILLNFGTNIKSHLIPHDKIDIIMKTLSKLNQRIIFKWESDDLHGKPKNILVKKWLPQSEILAHKNIKLFISHCGMGGVLESKYHGVPVLAIPFFGDQMKNSDGIVMEGWAIRLDFESLTQEKLTESIEELLNNQT